MSELSNYKSMSNDKLVVALLCTTIALENSSTLSPLTVREWNDFETALERSGLTGIGEILTMDADRLHAELAVEQELAARIERLLARSESVTKVLESLSELGIWFVTRLESSYPAKLLSKLGQKSPVVFFGAGDLALVRGESIAIVGSRDISETGREFAQRLGEMCASAGAVVVSGAARGTDRIAMSACLANGGSSVGVVAESLERIVGEPDVHEALAGGNLCLLSQFSPSAPFSIGAAMGRNKFIYALADHAIVVESAMGKGGTWSGAVENIRAAWTPMFVRSDDDAPAGNLDLLRQGGIALTSEELRSRRQLTELLSSKSEQDQVTGVSDETNGQALKDYLRSPRKIAEIAQFLEISEKSARSLLENGIEKGRIKMIKKRPATYQDVESLPPTSADLFG